MLHLLLRSAISLKKEVLIDGQQNDGLLANG
jgi:hypothetical protein